MNDTPKEQTFHVYRLIDGQWKFWFNGRGKSAKDLHRRAAWAAKVQREHIKVEGPVTSFRRSGS